MIKINETALSFCNMGLFHTREEWIHPTVTLATYELILVTEGVVYIREENEEYCLEKGDMLLLYPYKEHGGIRSVHGHTAFYWLHFSTDDISRFPIERRSTPNSSRAQRAMKDMMQYQQRSEKELAELILARFLMECALPVERKSKTAHEIAEYVRINSSKPITVCALADHFGYTPDHLSRLLRAEFSVSAKELISEKRLSYIQSLLLNTNDSIKEIAHRCGFDDENNFVKFFKYHEGITPTEFRNEFFRIHMNSR